VKPVEEAALTATPDEDEANVMPVEEDAMPVDDAPLEDGDMPVEDGEAEEAGAKPVEVTPVAPLPVDDEADARLVEEAVLTVTLVDDEGDVTLVDDAPVAAMPVDDDDASARGIGGNPIAGGLEPSLRYPYAFGTFG
jgi:hypothetical protein